MDKKNVINPLTTAFDAFCSRFDVNPRGGILVAVSGGLDSTVLAHLLFRVGVKPLALAHCNFNLRGADSLRDQEAVKRLGRTLGIPVFTKSFPAAATADAKGVSIQMAARQLRYDWFEETRKKLGFRFVATAHHANDNAETVLQHLIQGTGLAGLRGIPPVNGFAIRPLLFVNKDALRVYALEHDLLFQTDESNEKTDYLRNKIRLNVMPKLLELNPALVGTMSGNAERLRQAHLVYQHAVEKHKSQLATTKNGRVQINIRALRSHPAGETLLFELLKDFGFNTAQSKEIFDAAESDSGKVFFSNSHRLLKDRRHFFVAPKEALGFYHLIEQGSGTFDTPVGKMTLETIPNSPHINFDNTRYQFLDADKLTFPLMLRPWKKGDYVYPFGLNKKKKISDVFTDRKFSLLEKETQPLLLSNEHVIAIPGNTIDHRFRVTPSTKAVLKIRLQTKNKEQ